MFEFTQNVKATDPVWTDAKQKIIKYVPLLKINSTDKHRKILKELYL